MSDELTRTLRRISEDATAVRDCDPALVIDLQMRGLVYVVTDNNDDQFAHANDKGREALT